MCKCFEIQQLYMLDSFSVNVAFVGLRRLDGVVVGPDMLKVLAISVAL